MTIIEAEQILDLVESALLDQSQPTFQSHPSVLKGHDLFDVVTALKLRIANEYLQLSEHPDFDTRFAEGLRLYDGIPTTVMGMFVTYQMNNPQAPRVFYPVNVETMQLDIVYGSLESCYSFGDFCKDVGSQDLLFWKKIYARLDLDYTSSSPQGNVPVRS